MTSERNRSYRIALTVFEFRSGVMAKYNVKTLGDGGKMRAMKRAYILGCRDRESVGARTPVDVFFTFQAEEALTFLSKDEAQRQCEIFDSFWIRVEWAENGQYVCKDFQVEERSPAEFVIFCDGPLLRPLAYRESCARTPSAHNTDSNIFVCVLRSTQTVCRSHRGHTP